MFDAALRPFIDRALNPVGAYLAKYGVSANMVSLVGFGFGMLAALAVALGFGSAAVTLIIVNRVCDGLDGAVARATRRTDLGGFL